MKRRLWTAPRGGTRSRIAPVGCVCATLPASPPKTERATAIVRDPTVSQDCVLRSMWSSTRWTRCRGGARHRTLDVWTWFQPSQRIIRVGDANSSATTSASGAQTPGRQRDGGERFSMSHAKGLLISGAGRGAVTDALITIRRRRTVNEDNRTLQRLVGARDQKLGLTSVRESFPQRFNSGGDIFVRC